MLLTTQLLRLLKQNEEYIKENNLEMVYYKLNEAYVEGNLEPDEIGDFTSWVLSKGRNPLENMDYVPQNYLYHEQTLEKFRVPDKCMTIFEYTAAWSNIEVLYLPESMYTIGENAFRGCQKLRKIIYAGTTEAFKKIKIMDNAFKDCHVLNRLETKDEVLNPATYLELFNK